MFRNLVGRRVFRCKGLRRFKASLFLSILRRVRFYELFRFFSLAYSVSFIFLNFVMVAEQFQGTMRLPLRYLTDVFPLLQPYGRAFKRLELCAYPELVSGGLTGIHSTSKFILTFIPTHSAFFFGPGTDSFGVSLLVFLCATNIFPRFLSLNLMLLIFSYLKIFFFSICRLIISCPVSHVFVIKRN